MKKLQAILGVILVLGVAAAAASVAVAKTGKTDSVAAGPSCKMATIAVTGPFTGPAASAGIDQRELGRPVHQLLEQRQARFRAPRRA